MAETAGAPAKRGGPKVAWWRDERTRGVLYQVLTLGLVLAVVAYLVRNTMVNLETRNIATGFGFLGREAGFDISESPIAYGPHNTYLRALLVGLLNTLIIAGLGVALATVVGVIAGVARLSQNWLVARMASIYVEVARNVPVLLQLFFWYAVVTEGMPGPRQAYHPAPGVFLSNRGVKLPAPEWGATSWLMAGALLAAVAVVVALARWARRRQERTGEIFPTVKVGCAILLGAPFAAWLLGGAPTAMSVPELQGFNFTGGISVSPEFTALLVGLVLYTAAFIAEIVRGGILAVPHGQTEAASALGLSRGMILRLITLPQAMRVIIPPLTSQYLNLTKNSSLAVAIGYPDLVSAANTAINQTGQAVEGVLVIMAVYLTISLSIAAFMNWYNKRIALKGGR